MSRRSTHCFALRTDLYKTKLLASEQMQFLHQNTQSLNIITFNSVTVSLEQDAGSIPGDVIEIFQ